MIKLICVVIITICVLFSIVGCKAVPIQEYERQIPHKILDSFMNHPTKDLFKVFHYVYKKTTEYELNSEEGVRRYKAFKDNLKYIKEENSKEENTYSLGLTPFADLTNQEFRDKYLMKTSSMEKMKNNFLDNSLSSEDYFDKYADSDDDDNVRERSEIDWTSNFGWAKNQGTCGSCWAFSTTEAVQAARKQKYGGDNLALSPQQMVDCTTTCFGCEGGYPDKAMEYVRDFGLVSERQYKYEGKQNQCQSDVVSNGNPFKVKNFAQCYDCSDDEWYSLLQRGPLVIVIDAGSRKFQLYMFGVLYLNKSDCAGENHAVTAMGWKKRSWLFNNDEFIKIRNSWGLLWGEVGNVNVAYRPNENKSCFVTKVGVLPIV